MRNMKAPIKYHTGLHTREVEGDKLVHLPAPCKHPDTEAISDLVITYDTGICSQSDRLSCDEHISALTALAVVLLLLHSPVSEEEKKALAPLHPVGVEAARIVRLRQKWKPIYPMQIDVA
jgi:hypothetical protein